MSLDERIDFGDRQISTIEGEGLCLALTEPHGGEIRIGISMFNDDDRMPSKVLAITCDGARAREIAAQLIEFAELVEADA